MQLNRVDLAYLVDIFNYSSEIISFIKGMKYYHFEKDNKTIRAVERNLEIIGEASNNISDDTKNILSQIPWHEIKGLRNRLAHDYGNIIIFRIWEIAKKDIPILIKELKKLKELKRYC